MWVNKTFLKEHYQYVSEDKYVKKIIKDLHEGMILIFKKCKKIFGY